MLRQTQGQTNTLLMLFPEHTLFFFHVSPKRWHQPQPTAPGRAHARRLLSPAWLSWTRRCPGLPQLFITQGSECPCPSQTQTTAITTPLGTGTHGISAPRLPCSRAASPSQQAQRTWKTPGNVPALQQIHVPTKTRCRPMARPDANLIEWE